MKHSCIRFLAATAFLTVCGFTHAQSAHYPAGVEGLKAATLPPPGLYLRDYNYFYLANRFPGGPDDFDLFAYVQAPRVIWITDQKILGGYYGVDILLPLVYQDIGIGPNKWSDFGVGDVFWEPVTLSWHLKQFDIGVGYGFWTPNGAYDPMNNPAAPGKGFFTHMLTAGATWYIDQAKTWNVSLLNRYEINHENSTLAFTPGQVWTLEYGIGKTFNKTFDVGVVGYWVMQTTEDTGNNASNAKDQLFGVGPEFNAFWPKIGLFTSARYIYDAEARNRPQGHTINVTLTKIF